jgi:outer membrane protein TolC
MTAQRDLSIAELDMVTAMTTYEKAKIALDRAIGSALEHNGIRLQDAENGSVAIPSP